MTLEYRCRQAFHKLGSLCIFRPRPTRTRLDILQCHSVSNNPHAFLARYSHAAANPALSFPCLDAIEQRSESLRSSAGAAGPEPNYNSGASLLHRSGTPLHLDWGGVLTEFQIAYETWGELNASRSNAILLHTGLSASSHAHSNIANSQPGWWERFIGPGAPLDTDKYYVICTNVIGGCYGSTGPSSINVISGKRYATHFPILTIEDMVRAQFHLLDTLRIEKLYASVGASMGGMQSLAAGVLFPGRVGRIVSISGCARSHPYSIAMRHMQRQVLMMDSDWNRGFYYDSLPPHAGMKLAREIATVTYRSGPEWEQRFGRQRANPSQPPALCPDFLIETYLDHAGEKWCLNYDANSLLYISKAMDLFDLGRESQEANSMRRNKGAQGRQSSKTSSDDSRCSLALPPKPYAEQNGDEMPHAAQPIEPVGSHPPMDLIAGLLPLRETPTLIMGVASDILFSAWQQREVASSLRLAGNRNVNYVELSEQQSLFGHDTFLLDIKHVGGNLRLFLG